MSTGTKIGIVSACVGLVLIVMLVVSAVGMSNSEVRLRNQATAQQENIGLVYDKTWKIIQQQAQVSDQYASQFKEIYGYMMSERYKPGSGTVMQWIKEDNPNFSPEMMITLNQSIASQRTNFAYEQKKLLDIKRVHDDVLTTFPSSLICGSRPAIKVQLVTSGQTKEAMRTGEDNNVDLFNK